MLWVFAIDGKVDEGGMYNAQVIDKMLPASETLIREMRIPPVRGSLLLSLVGGGDGAADDEPRLRG